MSRSNKPVQAQQPKFARATNVPVIGRAAFYLGVGATSIAATPLHAADAPRAVDATRQQFNIPAADLDAALMAFGQKTGLLVSVDPALTTGKRAPALHGEYTTTAALRRLLSGSGLRYRFADEKTVVIAAGSKGTGQGETLAPINVEGEQGNGYAGQFETDEGLNAQFQTSATKTPVSLRETPQSVSVITQESLKARQVQTLGQALETAAGVNQYSGAGPFGGSAPFGFQSTQIRGVNIDPRFDIRIDGFSGLPFYAKPDVAIFERIEAVKGPNSVLYGRGSAGGFINQVTKKPLPEFAAEVAVSGGSYDRYRVDVDVGGPLAEGVRGRLVAAYQDSEAFVDGLKSERILVAPSLEFDLSDRTRVLFQLLYQDDNFIPNQGVPLVVEGGRARAPNISRSLFLGVPNAHENEWKTRSATAEINHELTDNWSATLRLNRARSETPIDVDSYVYGSPVNGDVSLTSSNFDPNDADVWSGEFRLEGNVELLGRPATVGFGVDRSQVETLRNDEFVTLGTANIYAEDFEDFPTMQPANTGTDFLTNQENTGAYAQFMVRPLDWLSVLLGGRYDQADTESGPRAAVAKDDKNEFTGRGGLVFDLHSNVSAYLLYAESFSPVSGVDQNGAVLDPETGQVYEAGLKTEWLDRRLSANLAAFQIDRENVAIAAPGVGNNFSISSGKQRSEGVELEINGQPINGWNVSLGAVLLDTEFTERDDPLFGRTPAGAADWQLGLYTSYELQSGPARGFGLGAGLFAIDDRGVSAFTFVPDAKLDGYERVDVSAFYNGFKNYEFALQIRNVFDERYIEGADRIGSAAQFGSPTAALVTVRYKFGE